MSRKQWALGIICMLLGIIIIMGSPVSTQAASQSDRSAYQAVFDATYYYNAYADVAAACGADEEALFNHFVSFGIYEGRSASASFNPQAYKQRYTDLQEAFGNDMAAYCRHYVAFGRAEGRNAAADGQAEVQITVTVPKKTATVDSTSSDKTAEKETAKKSETGDSTKKITEEDTSDSEDEDKTDETDKTSQQEEASENETVNTAKSASKEETSEEKSQTKKSQAKETASVSETDAPSVSTGDAATDETEEETADAISAETVIGSYTTYYETGVSRAVNVELAAQRINGVVVEPGAGFSFSNTILDRTTANGYVEGPIFINGEKGTGIGGGVCQVSSTLYAAMINAELPATERHAHSLPVDYLPEGLDATIAGNYMDLKFTNIFSQPLLIEASAEGGKLTVTLTLQ